MQKNEMQNLGQVRCFAFGIFNYFFFLTFFICSLAGRGTGGIAELYHRVGQLENNCQSVYSMPLINEMFGLIYI
jgi:hypothetical protein